MKRDEIIDAYLFLRKNNHDITDDTLDFMKEASLNAFDAAQKAPCEHEPLLNNAPPKDGQLLCKKCGEVIGWHIGDNGSKFLFSRGVER